MTAHTRELLRELITNSGKPLMECEHDGVLEELLEDSSLSASDHNSVLCVLEEWDGSPRRKRLLEFLFDE